MPKTKIITAVLCTAVIMAAMLATRPPNEKQAAVSTAPSQIVPLPLPASADAQIEAAAAFVVREVDGIVYAFSSTGETLPLYDINPSILREADAAALREGVALHDAEALARLIEDFGS